MVAGHAAMKRGEHIGCGCKSLEQLWMWFTRPEMDRLHTFGYHLVSMDVDQILAESDIQLVFARKLPLSERLLIVE